MTEAEKFTDVLIKRLEECAKSFYNETNALSLEVKTNYNSKLQAADNILSHEIDIYYNEHIVRFSYYPHIPLSTSHSILTCYVSLSKSDSQRLFYPLSQIYGFLGVTPSYALTLPLILSADSMTECFECIADSLTAIHSDIKTLSCSQGKKDALFDAEFGSACDYFKSRFPTTDDIKSEIDKTREEWYGCFISDTYEQPLSPEDETNTQSGFEQILLRINDEAQSMLLADKQKFLTFYFLPLLSRSLSSGFESYMVGNYPAAIKKLKKLKNKTQYENLLIDYMENAESPRRHIPESIYKNLTELYKNGISKNNFKEALAIAPAMIIFGAPWAALFLLIYFLFFYFENKNSVYLLGPLENAPCVILPALIMGIVTVSFNMDKFYKLFFRKNSEKLTALQTAASSRSALKFMKGLSAVLLICSTAFLFLTVHQNIKLTENGFYDNTAFFSINGPFYEYEDVERLYYQQQTPNGNGGTFPYPSYAIILKNGERIDIDQFDSCNEKFLNVFKDKGVEVEQKYN